MCTLSDSSDIELYYYGELDAAARLHVEAHTAQCAECRDRLDDLRTIRRALAARGQVDAPPLGDWSGFMARLDEYTDLESVSVQPQEQDARSMATSHRSLTAAVALAAMVALVTLSVLMAARFRTVPRVTAPLGAGSRAAAASGVSGPAGSADRAFVEMSEQHFERSKLVVLGLATRDPQKTVAGDWEYERQLAGSLLSDTRLYRLAAQDRGLTDVARVMGDLETVLLEASLSDHADRGALDRVQRLIHKRDLLVKMQVMGTSGT